MSWHVPTESARRTEPVPHGPTPDARGASLPPGFAAAPQSTSDNAAPPAFLPAPTLPKGGGAIRGIGETFTVNPARGTGGLTVPLALSPGRRGEVPPLALHYDTGAGNSAFGLGFSIGQPRISRRTDRGVPRYVDDGPDADTFVYAGAEPLVPTLASQPDGSWAPVVQTAEVAGVVCQVRRYRPRTETAFTRIEFCRPVAGGAPFWRTLSRDNTASLYGRGATARVADPRDLRPGPDPARRRRRLRPGRPRLPRAPRRALLAQRGRQRVRPDPGAGAVPRV